MVKANRENFIKMYFSGHRVESAIYFVEDSTIEWYFNDRSIKVFLVSPETHRQYLKFVEEFEKNKPLLAELR